GEVPDLSLASYVPLIPPKGAFWADPFPVLSRGRRFVFVEEMSYPLGRAHIAVLELHRDGTWSNSEPVLTQEYHLSYPFVFSWENEWYLMPESATARAVHLYRAVDFPYIWEPYAVALDQVDAADATLTNL